MHNANVVLKYRFFKVPFSCTYNTKAGGTVELICEGDVVRWGEDWTPEIMLGAVRFQVFPDMVAGQIRRGVMGIGEVTEGQHILADVGTQVVKRSSSLTFSVILGVVPNATL